MCNGVGNVLEVVIKNVYCREEWRINFWFIFILNGKVFNGWFFYR